MAKQGRHPAPRFPAGRRSGSHSAPPDLDPIEQVFAKLKALLRQATPRRRETLWRTIGEKLGSFSPTECTNYLRNYGYGHPA